MYDIAASASAEAFMSPPPAGRRMWIDLARGIGVILVVFGHMQSGLVNAGLFPAGAVADWLHYSLYSFHMPLFFYLSALNVRSSLRRGPQKFLSAKCRTVVYPYFLWSVLQGGAIMLVGDDANMPVMATDLIGIWYRPIAQFWFLYALMICHVLVVILPGRRIMVGVAVISLAVFESRMSWPDIGLVLHDLPAYALGLYPIRLVRPELRWLAGQPRMFYLVFTWLTFAASIAFGGWAGMNPNGVASIPACISGIAGVVLLSQYIEHSAMRWMARVGAMSMTIYVMHLLAGAGTRIVVQHLRVPLGPWAYLFLCTSAGVVLPMLAHSVLDRCDLLAALGLGPSRRHKILAERRDDRWLPPSAPPSWSMRFLRRVSR